MIKMSNKCLVIKILIQTLQHYMLHGWRYIEFELKAKCVPKDVGEGHFVVVASECEKPTRFVVGLRCLTNPRFLRLLKKAGEEYGFKHDGAIEIPCEPNELKMILQEMEDE